VLRVLLPGDNIYIRHLPASAPDPLALLSAFCAAGQPKAGAAPQAKKIWFILCHICLYF
jgi:hypothetical protein